MTGLQMGVSERAVPKNCRALCLSLHPDGFQKH